MDPCELHRYAEELLVAAAESLDTIPDLCGTGYDGAPERQLISPGVPVADCCPMLAVWIANIGEGARTPAVLAADVRINRPQFHVLILRCIPSGTMQNGKYVPPTAEALTAASAQHHADVWALWNHLLNLVNAFPDSLLFSKCQDLLWAPALAQTPAGGCAGWQLTLLPGIDGYNEDLGT